MTCIPRALPRCATLAAATLLVTAGGLRGPRWPLYREARAVAAPQAMVVSVSPIAPRVGVEILQRGGNALDAAVAVGFALAVVHPAAGNIGGGGFMVMRFADGTVNTIDYRETAPGRATPDMYLDSAGELTGRSLTGALAAGVPGTVAGLFEMQHRFGRLPWRELLPPAVGLAGEGLQVDWAHALIIRCALRQPGPHPPAADKFQELRVVRYDAAHRQGQIVAAYGETVLSATALKWTGPNSR